MSVSIYYEAERKHKLNDEEKAEVSAIVERYCAKYPFEEKYEDFCLYSEPFDSEETVLQGSTALPAGGDIVYDILCYWLECLTELTRYLQGCQWHVNIDDMDLTWDEDSGWLPDI